MNVVEMAVLIGFAASGFSGGYFLSHRLGGLGWVVGLVLGLGCWGGFCWGFKVLVHKFMELYPARPTCARGKCNGYDYKFLGMKSGNAELQCLCGDKYLAKRNRFMAINEKGEPRPFMSKSHTFGRWRKDETLRPAG
jgi:hypothetical protein